MFHKATRGIGKGDGLLEEVVVESLDGEDPSIGKVSIQTPPDESNIG
jgi:hypothetical protein